MANDRSYNLLCPIARALDHVGDRWTLLILRDLHAGPARFKDLQTGLSAIAANLLSARLRALEASGLIEKTQSEHGLSLYSLTGLGVETRHVLFELAKLGVKLPHPVAIKQPGNHRSIAVTLQEACQRAIAREHNFEAAFDIDGEAFRMTAKESVAEIRVGTTTAPDITITSSYEPLIALIDDQNQQGQVLLEHFEPKVATRGKEVEFFELLFGAFQHSD